MWRMRQLLLIGALAALAGCSARTPAEAQTFGQASGVFTRFQPRETLCQLITIQGTSLNTTFVEPGSSYDALTLSLVPIARADRRFIVEAPLRYGNGQATTAVLDVERGHRLLDPSTEHIDAGPVTGLIFPLFIHHLRVTPARLCNETALGVPQPDDCLEVPESTLHGAKLWCSVGVLAAPEFSE